MAKTTGTGRAGAGRVALSSVHTPPTANSFINALEKGIYQNTWEFRRGKKVRSGLAAKETWND